jgi:LTXXQ motif family protein
MFPSSRVFHLWFARLVGVFEMKLKITCALAVVVGTIAVLGFFATARAQQPSSNTKVTSVALIPGALRGLGSMGARGAHRFCDPRAIGLSQWRITALTQILGLNEPQQSSLSDLAVTSAKALEMIAATCLGRTPDKSPLSVIEARIETLLQVLKTVRPAYESFYAKLDDTQKRRLDALGPGRRGWRW